MQVRWVHGFTADYPCTHVHYLGINFNIGENMSKLEPFFVKPRPKPDYSYLFLHSEDYGSWDDDDGKNKYKKKKSKKEKKYYG